jgi:hypothetical protein
MPIYGQISQNDLGIISWDFKGADGSVYSSYSLLKLAKTDTPQKRTLSAYLDNLLYEGKTAEAYLNDRKKESSNWKYEHHGQLFTWNVKGRFLCIKRESYGSSGSSYQNIIFYIIDTQSLKRLTVDDIFVNANNSGIKKLIINRLSKHENYKMIDQEILQKTITEKSYGIFYEKQGISFHWDKSSIAANAFGAFDVVLPRSEIESYLTPVGKELLK